MDVFSRHHAIQLIQLAFVVLRKNQKKSIKIAGKNRNNFHMHSTSNYIYTYCICTTFGNGRRFIVAKINHFGANHPHKKGKRLCERCRYPQSNKSQCRRHPSKRNTKTKISAYRCILGQRHVLWSENRWKKNVFCHNNHHYRGGSIMLFGWRDKIEYIIRKQCYLKKDVMMSATKMLGHKWTTTQITQPI